MQEQPPGDGPSRNREEEPSTQLSADGSWWWDGERWVPALSPDGLWRWDGTRWQPVTDLDTANPTALVEGLDRLVDARFAEGGHLLALRAHEWRARDPELAALVAEAAPLAARLAALDARLAGGGDGGGGVLNLRQLLGGDEREQQESEAQSIEAELRPLAVLIGRMAPQPSLKEADELLVPARRLAEKVVELSEAVAEERRLTAEQEAQAAEAGRRLEAAREERERSLRDLEDQLRARELERAKALEELERGLRRVRIPVPGAPLARFEGVVLYENRVDTPDGRGPLEGAEAVVAGAGELWASHRETLNQLGLLEAMHAGRFFDALVTGADLETYLLVLTPYARSLVPVDPGQEEAAREFAAQLKAAARKAGKLLAEREAQVQAAEAALHAAMEDTAAVDEARAAFEGAAADAERNRPVAEAEAEANRAAGPTPEIEAARARVDAVAERLLEPPPPLAPAKAHAPGPRELRPAEAAPDQS